MKDRLLLIPILILLVIAISGLVGSANKPAEAVMAPQVTAPICLPNVICTTITVPGPTITQTVTRPPRGRATVTTTRIIRRPARTETIFRRPPTVTETERLPRVTTTKTATRQVTVTHATIVPTTRVSEKVTILPGTTITVEKVKKVGIGLLSLFIILLCVLGGMWFGWTSGIKQGANNGEPKFLIGMRQALRLPRGKHR